MGPLRVEAAPSLYFPLDKKTELAILALSFEVLPSGCFLGGHFVF